MGGKNLVSVLSFGRHTRERGIQIFNAKRLQVQINRFLLFRGNEGPGYPNGFYPDKNSTVI